ncbi:hypothetical protein [Sulfitobacter maritimus]|uniref:hypothetical protein n=1 Tax=Sulfitobacter maritimus TaxID=2741719 RepID=UPI001FE9D216|nr:hypothetical protein [Sulfitobacter maritimus]
MHVILGCKTCGTPTLKRISVVLGHNPECPHCIRIRRETAARTVGATLCGPDPDGHRHYGLYEFICGHRDRRQHTRVEAAAAGGHQLSCTICLHERHAIEAGAQGWQLLGDADRPNKSYRRYEHLCGHQQDAAIANMRRGDIDCAGCGESWSSKPSKIYLMAFTLPETQVLKLGFSSNPEFRLRQVQENPKMTKGALLRETSVDTGHRAICIEKALHNHIATHRPDLIVPPELFQSHMRITSEIYHRHGKTYISALLDALASGWDPSVQQAAFVESI